MIGVLKRIVGNISREKGEAIGLDRMDLEMMPDSLSKELLAMMNLSLEEDKLRQIKNYLINS